MVSLRENGDVFLRFSEKERAVTKGQAVVLYNGDLVLGGGTIIEGYKKL
nr:aminomethyltransferase beta-barrel domain-containing protein [uncultured Oribacterium sp.]